MKKSIGKYLDDNYIEPFKVGFRKKFPKKELPHRKITYLEAMEKLDLSKEDLSIIKLIEQSGGLEEYIKQYTKNTSIEDSSFKGFVQLAYQAKRAFLEKRVGAEDLSPAELVEGIEIYADEIRSLKGADQLKSIVDIMPYLYFLYKSKTLPNVD